MSEVKFSAETLAVLKKLQKINQCLKINKDSTQLTSMNESKTIAAYIEIAETLPRTFCVYDLAEFITVLGVIENPVVDFSNDKFVVIKSENGSQKLRYIDGEEGLINSYTDKKFSLPSEDLTIKVTGPQLKSVLSAAGALKLEYVGFKSDNGKVYLSAFARNNGDGNDTNGYSIEVGETDAEFNLYYKTESLQILDGETTFVISKKKISMIENGKAKYFVALDANSTSKFPEKEVEEASDQE
jgi:hypothetical protein